MASSDAGPIRLIFRFLKHLPDRLLHPLRRRRLKERLASRAERPREILFVCHGNVCRSPYAEVAFRGMIPDEARYDPVLRSVGFVGPGRPSPDTAIRVARRRGVDLTGHRSALLSVAGVRRSELIVVMNADQRRDISMLYGASARREDIVVLGDLDPERIRRRGIPDPFRGDDDDFDESYERIDRCLKELATALGVITPDELPVAAVNPLRSPGRIPRSAPRGPRPTPMEGSGGAS